MSARVTRITLGPAPGEAKRSAAPRGASPRAAWLLPPIFLLAIFAGVSVVFRGPDALFGWTIALLFGLGLAWIGISALLPSRADRTCPSCGREALRRMDPRTTRGLVCSACGHRDELASSWYLAEEEGPLEDIVLRERERRRDARGASSPTTERPT